MPDEPNPSANHDARASRVVQGLAAELKRNRPDRAARLLDEALAHHGFAPASDLYHWLAGQLGKPASASLVKEYAHRKCFCCKSGLEKCGRCQGRGFLGSEEACETCGSLGAARCDFCDGTGLVTYNAIPTGLRIPAGQVRVSEAASRLRALIRAADEADVSSPEQAGMKRLGRDIIAANAVMGVCENAVVMLNHLPDETRGSRGASQLEKAALQCGMRAMKLARKLLKMLLANATLLARSNTRSAGRHAARQRAAFFKQVLESERMQAWIGLHHPFLADAIDKRKQPPPDEPKPARRSIPADKPR